MLQCVDASLRNFRSPRIKKIILILAEKKLSFKRNRRSLLFLSVKWDAEDWWNIFFKYLKGNYFEPSILSLVKFLIKFKAKWTYFPTGKDIEDLRVCRNETNTLSSTINLYQPLNKLSFIKLNRKRYSWTRHPDHKVTISRKKQTSIQKYRKVQIKTF